MRLHGLQKKLYLFTCDKMAVNRKILQMRRSLDELQKMLNKKTKKKGKELD